MSTEQSIELFKRAGQPVDLHLMKDVDHHVLRTERSVFTGVHDGEITIGLGVDRRKFGGL